MNSLEKKVVICLVLALIIVVFIPFYAMREPAREEAATIRIQTESVQRGKNTFLNDCSTCHGQQAQGLVGPSLIGKEGALVQKTVRNGRGIMPAFSSNQVSDEDLEDIINFLGSLTPQTSGTPQSNLPAPTSVPKASPSSLPTSVPTATPSATVNSPTLPSSPVPASSNTPQSGDLVRLGEELFQHTAGGIGCASCHGADAKGLIGPNIRGSSDQEIGDALKNVAAMNFLKLTDNDIQALAAYLKSLNSQP